jgi:hypothetical protein
VILDKELDKEKIMRKRIMKVSKEASANASMPRDEKWLDVEQVALVEISSEKAEQPIEKALLASSGKLGWCAGESGEQVIRLIFDEAQEISRIFLHFIETEVERTQEFVLSWSEDKGEAFQEIVRQQWNFNSGCREEIEDYRMKLANVGVIELIIKPDIKGGEVYASLEKLRLG